MGKSEWKKGARKKTIIAWDGDAPAQVQGPADETAAGFSGS
jgi:hypothetical protein